MRSEIQAPGGNASLWHDLANWLALAALLALGIVWSPADAAQAQAERAGTLWLKSAPDAAPAAALRQQTRMHATVTGSVVRVQVTQTFTNAGNGWVEGLYVFPLPADCAVDELRMQIGERTIVGEIRARQAAHEAYEQARREGRRASLVDQERPNMFTSAVANIPPGGTVTISIGYLESLPYRDGRYTLSLPLTITPRYTPGMNGDTAAVYPETPELVSAAVQRVAIEVELDPGFALEGVQSLYHAIRTSATASGERITLAAEEAPADRDFELTWKPQVTPDTQAAAFAETSGADTYMLLLLTPPQMTTRQVLAREVIFIIDTSGSMQGPSIEQARAALELGVARLKPTDRFNVIRFSDEASALFRAAQPASAVNVAAASGFIGALRASGGTEMRGALELAFASAPDPERLRQIVFITDGSVGNEDELVRMIQARSGSGRLFTVGIGAAPNAYFMHAAAAAGRGSYTFIGNRAQVQERMTDLFQKLERPALTNLEVRWPGNVPAELAAALPADVYAGDPLVIAARLPQLPQGLLTLSGTSEGHPWMRQVPITAVSPQAGIAKLWARERIAALSQGGLGAQDAATRQGIVSLALAHHLVSDFTSLIAVDLTPVRPAHEPLDGMQVPGAAPQGSYWAAGSTGFARTATPAPLLALIGGFALALAGLLFAAGRGRTARVARQP